MKMQDTLLVPPQPSRVGPTLNRTTFSTSRLLDFCSKKELVTQTGHDTCQWPLVVVKELVDNALDACEEADVAPDIQITVGADGIVVNDNGPGIPATTIQGTIDYAVRVSSREAYVSPTRGAQGNALKTILAMPFVLDGNSGVVEIGSHGIRHRIEFRLDSIRQRPDIELTSDPDEKCKNGTTITVRWPGSASSIITDAADEFLQIANGFAWANPHLTIAVDWFGSRVLDVKATAPDWRKWEPSYPTSPHWYTTEHLKRLIAGYIANGDGDRPLREFVAEFRGLSGSAKQKKVLGNACLSRITLANLTNDGRNIDDGRADNLLRSMKDESRPVKPTDLGIIGKDHLLKRCEAEGCDPDTFHYKLAKEECDGLPFLVEVAFAAFNCAFKDGPKRKRLCVSGINWSPGINDPFRRIQLPAGENSFYAQSLDTLLAERYSGTSEPIALFVHLVCPRVQYADRGKSAVSLPLAMQASLASSVRAVTGKWYKQRKSEERQASREARRREVWHRESRDAIRDACYRHIRAAYMKASANGTLPAGARQIMYAARGPVQDDTGETLHAQYFQTVLKDYLLDHPDDAKAWDVVFDARGHLWEPHTGAEVALGTLGVRTYLNECDDAPRDSDDDLILPTTQDTKGPTNRYGAILFIEKEGFMPLFRKAKLAERYDLAIASTKGMSVIAIRLLLDKLCGGRGLPLLILHDFDKAGFSILRTLYQDTKHHTFVNQVNAIDLGVRLDDVNENGLASETVNYSKSDPRPNLRLNGATADEVKFLCTGTYPYHGQRVELNAFMSDDLIRWIEGKLAKHGVKKVVPSADALASAYRYSASIHLLNEKIREAAEESRKLRDTLTVPDDLAADVLARLQVEPSLPWDEVVSDLARRVARLAA